MGILMDLVAGDERDILLALAIEDMTAFDDRERFTAHLALGDALDLAWLDEFSAAVRDATGGASPVDFVDARAAVPRRAATERVVERVDPAWVAAVADATDEQLDLVLERWAPRLEEAGVVPLTDAGRTAVGDLTAQLVAFCRAATEARTVIFAWGL